MQRTHLIEMFERVRGGLLWVQADGTIRHANADARRRTALRAGSQLDDPALLRAVQFAARGGQSRATLYSSGAQLLKCRVTPGLAVDDAFVLLAEEPVSDPTAESAEVLLRAVEHNLVGPLGRAREALALWRDDAEPLAVETLSAEVDALFAGLSRLCALGRLWSGAEELGDERLELWPLLQQAWSDVEIQALDGEVGLRFRCVGDQATMVPVYGRRSWLLRALAECLGAAVAATAPGGQLLVEQRQVGSTAMLRFRQPGMFIDRATGTQDTVTLLLCRQVLALHGGTLELDVGEGDWVLQIPTGAPVQDAGAELGMVQAQVYARDLSALMNRSRRAVDNAVSK